jgi:hypothetical protein
MAQLDVFAIRRCTDRARSCSLRVPLFDDAEQLDILLRGIQEPVETTAGDGRLERGDAITATDGRGPSLASKGV